MRTNNSTLNSKEIENYKLYTDIDTALKFLPDVIIITNPTSMHIDSAIKAANAGCHLFIEKPLSNSLDNINTLKSLVEKKELITMVGCHFRFHPLIKYMKSCYDNGDFGKIIKVYAEYGEYLPSWHPWENYKHSYSANEHLGGGVVLTLIHPMDYLYWIFGEISNVKSFQTKYEQLKTNVEDDISLILLKFKSGLLGQINLDFVQRQKVHKVTLTTEFKKIKFDLLRNNIYESENGIFKNVPLDFNDFRRNDMYINELKHFLSSVVRKKQTKIPLQQGIEVLKLSLIAKKSNTI